MNVDAHECGFAQPDSARDAVSTLYNALIAALFGGVRLDVAGHDGAARRVQQPHHQHRADRLGQNCVSSDAR